MGSPRHRAVLFGAGFGAAWGSAEHLHPLTTPAYTHLPLCLGLGPISCHLGVPSAILAPSACWSLLLAVPVGRRWTCASRDNLPGLHDPVHLPPWLGPHGGTTTSPLLSGGAKLLPASGKGIRGLTGAVCRRELGYPGSCRGIARGQGGDARVLALRLDVLPGGLWGHGDPQGLPPTTTTTYFWRRKRSPDGQVTRSMAEAALPSRGVSPPCLGHGPHRVLRPPPAPRDTLVGRGRSSVRGWRCFGAGRCGLRMPPAWHRAMLTHNSPQPSILWSHGCPGCRWGGGGGDAQSRGEEGLA